ncbi:N-acetyltransferase [Agromyces intestinalis]|uniref:N-acetyltransferase n=1 Tax=Agromyces intestinalis TaxID=2592652 RepID=A0A5C1YEG1_9MICO|nr:GNAT family N-acetyltransferase [Agromyces intestinalis]QEO13835.1 N-acetyltransferase [Agromyces intestinalis]
MGAADGFTMEYPDASGYPDGTGLLDEGTAALVAEVAVDGVREVDTPSAESDGEVAVRRDDGRRVYAAVLDGAEIAHVEYADEGGRLVVITTVVEPEFRGRGIAIALIADALDDLRERGERIAVRCPVVGAFMRSNPQYADLLAE